MNARPVTHPSGESLKAFSLGKLNDVQAETVISHLEECATCLDQVATHPGDDFLNRLRQAAGGNRTPLAAEGAQDFRGTLSAPSTPPAPRDLPPELANDPQYEILRELGRGGMGVVYLARHRLSGRQEVLKVMNKDLLADPENKERFRRGFRLRPASTTKRGQDVHSAGIGGLMVLVMGTSRARISPIASGQGPAPLLNAATTSSRWHWRCSMPSRKDGPSGHQAAEPDPDEQRNKHVVKVLDFSLAKIISERKSDQADRQGMVLRTPHYMSLEQWLDAGKADIQADIYGLGCTLYYLLTPCTAFRGQ